MPDRHDDDTETQSFREEQGKPPLPDPRDRMKDVPLAPSSAGVVAGPPPEEQTTVEEEREAAERRAREAKRL